MKYEDTLRELIALQGAGVVWMTLEDLAKQFHTSASTLHYWRAHAQFPKPSPPADGHTRLAAVIAWLDARCKLEAECLSLAQAAALVGRSASTFRRLVREQKLPAPIGRKLGSKAELWRRCDLDDATGGEPLPPPRHRRGGPVQPLNRIERGNPKLQGQAFKDAIQVFLAPNSVCRGRS